VSADKKNNNWVRVCLCGICAGVLAFIIALCVLEVVLPSQSEVDKAANYGYVYSGAKSSSVDFVVESVTGNTVFLFGSSELSTPSSTVPQVPAEVFGTNNYGLDLMLIGEAYDQSLWQSIAAGAYANVATNKKVALIVSPTWFEDAGLDNDTFKLRFSYSLYKAFCENENISESSKQYVARRLVEQGIDQAQVDAGQGATPVGALNSAFYEFVTDLQLRRKLGDVRLRGMQYVTEQQEAPDFAALYTDALESAEASCTNNNWGMDNAFYSASIEPNYERLAGTQTDETFSYETEFQDFSFFLKVCEEVGLEPLVIISPVHGQFYDYVGTSASDRQACYERIKQICENHGAAVADFSDKEYEQYFLHDIVHFGWTGWVEVEEAIYNYVKD
jgi:D-alanine transfer protein